MSTSRINPAIPRPQIRGRRDPYGNWFAWYAARPNHASLGGTPQAAVRALLACSLGVEGDWNLEPLRVGCIEARNEFEVDLAANARCPECRGTGRYVGLEHVEDCVLCGGSG